MNNSLSSPLCHLRLRSQNFDDLRNFCFYGSCNLGFFRLGLFENKRRRTTFEDKMVRKLVLLVNLVKQFLSDSIHIGYF